jgi:stearoyl-CoA desaturase (Delta-9 desaturase)
MTSSAATTFPSSAPAIPWWRWIPLGLIHLGCLGAFWVGVSPAALTVCFLAYFLRVFALTAGYHRLFSHNSYKTSRGFQFLLALGGVSSMQLGPLWWASIHRHHHICADKETDVHSPSRRGFFWAHLGWIASGRYRRTEMERVKDFAAYPELVFLDRHARLIGLSMGALWLALGEGLRLAKPSWNTSGPQLLVWGFFISTVLVYHVTFSINSLAHMVGRRRFETPDTSRNNTWLALLAMGEGYHNNHHRYAASARQGFYWWEPDLSYTLLRLLAAVGVVWALRLPPASILAEGRARRKGGVR